MNRRRRIRELKLQLGLLQLEVARRDMEVASRDAEVDYWIRRCDRAAEVLDQARRLVSPAGELDSILVAALAYLDNSAPQPPPTPGVGDVFAVNYPAAGTDADARSTTA